MNENFDAAGGPIGKRGEASPENPAPEQDNHGRQNWNAAFQGNGKGPAPKLDLWVVLDLLARRWYWPFLGSLFCGAVFFLLGFYFIQPKFTATGQLFRFETPGASEFFKTTTPMSPETFSGLIRSPELLHNVGEKVRPPIPPEKLDKRIKIDPEPDSDIITISLVAGSPQQAVELLNDYLEDAVKFVHQLEAKQAGEVAKQYLSNQVQEMDQEIQRLQQRFRGVPMSAALTNKLSEVGTNLNALSQSLALTERPSGLVSMQTERLNKALGDLGELLSKYTEIHPLVKQKQAEIEALKSEISHESTNRALTATFSAGAVGGTSNGPGFNPELDMLQIALRSLEDGRVQLVNRLNEAKLYAEHPPGTVRIQAAASLKTVKYNLHWIKIGIVAFFGCLMGFGASLCLLTVAEFADNRLKTVDDVKRVTRLPVIGALGDLGHMDDEQRSLWAFRTWTMLQGKLSPSSNHGLVCGITSSKSGEGRSTWIRLLAEAASRTGFRVLTIATRPSPSHVEGDSEEVEQLPWSEPYGSYDNGSGSAATALTTNVLTSPAKVTDQLTGPNSQPMVHIPLPGWVWNLERRKQWRDALSQWRQIDNLVILVELPPACVAEAVLLGSNLPNMVWLADSNSATAGETRDQIETLRHARCNLVGAVLNRQVSPPLRTRFPRWITCLIALTVFGQSLSRAQESSSQESPASPAQESRAQESTNDPAELMAATSGNAPAFTDAEPAAAVPETNRWFSVVQPSQRAAWQQRLTLGPGDELNFGLYGEPELVRLGVVVGPDGRVSYLEAQDVLATGRTIDELRGAMDQELSKYRRSPRTLITPVVFRSKKYFMLGKVMAKGAYTLDRPLTIVEAIARAKGFENGLVDRSVVDLADLTRSFVARQGKLIPLDFERLFEGGDLSQNLPLEPNDYIYIAPADLQEVYVVGEARLPGPVTYTPGLTIMEAITARGGYTDRSYKSKVLVVRGSLSHPRAIPVDTHAILKAEATDFKLQPRDIIFINSRPFIRVEELADLAMTAFIQSLITSWVDVRVVQPALLTQ